MSKDYFQFKQFRIGQEHCAMKVSTDACIQGAWTPLTAAIKRVCDIGAGTGLLSLMIAQRSPDCMVDAIEIDGPAAAQATINVQESVFAGRVQVHHTDALEWHAEERYDLIVCNPPFFTASLKSPDAQRNLARHTGDLNLETLAGLIADHLSEAGYASVLLPVSEYRRWQQAMSANGIFCDQHLWIKPFAHNTANRMLLLCSKEQKTTIEDTLVIYREPKVYTEDFIELMRPFYLYL